MVSFLFYSSVLVKAMGMLETCFVSFPRLFMQYKKHGQNLNQRTFIVIQATNSEKENSGTRLHWNAW